MEDWNLHTQPIHETQVIVVRGGAEVRVAHIQAHAHLGGGQGSLSPDALEEGIEQLRRVVGRVFDRQHQPRFRCQADQGLDSLDEGGHSRLMTEMNVEERRPELPGQLEVLPEPALALRPQRIGLQARVDR